MFEGVTVGVLPEWVKGIVEDEQWQRGFLIVLILLMLAGSLKLAKHQLKSGEGTSQR